MPWSAPPPAPQCPVCKRSVFATEAYMAADRTPYHMTCLKCLNCKKSLTPVSINEHEKKLFCPLCYEDLFNPQVKKILNSYLQGWTRWLGLNTGHGKFVFFLSSIFLLVESKYGCQ